MEFDKTVFRSIIEDMRLLNAAHDSKHAYSGKALRGVVAWIRPAKRERFSLA
jgi:hypothetical protein